MKKVIQIVLGVVIIVLGYILVRQILDPLDFQKTQAARESAVVERLKDIRTAQQAYKQRYQKYTDNFDTLINFVLHDSMVFQRAFGSKDDSMAVASGEYRVEEFKKPVIDTIFGVRKVTAEQIRQFPLIPNGEGVRFIMGATTLTTGSGVAVPVFEVKAPYKNFLMDLDEQLLINLIDERKTLNRYPGLKVGSLTEATNDAGNWEN